MNKTRHEMMAFCFDMFKIMRPKGNTGRYANYIGGLNDEKLLEEFRSAEAFKVINDRKPHDEILRPVL